MDSLMESSNSNLEKIRSIILEKKFQVIEMNSYTSNGGLRESITLSESRVHQLLSALGIDTVDISINTYGNQRILLNFEPDSWDRIDIYFSVEPRSVIAESNQPETRPVENEVVKLPEDSRTETASNSETKLYKIPKLDEIIEDTPIVMPINFRGGTSSILEEDRIYLDNLYETLMAYDNLTAHIRGHVCCQRNKKASKNRAELVYNYLINKGISKKRLSYRGYSNSQPIVYPEKNSVDRARNRRVDIVFKKGKK